MLFNFRLQPLEHVQPWGDAGSYRLHWFGLTDGHYWIQVGEDALFEYSEQARSELGATRYCDYQVVRLYEDLLEMLPYILDAVPTSLVSHLSVTRDAAWESKYDAWSKHACELLNEDEYWQLIDASRTWVSKRTLDTLYLVSGANIRIWSDRATVHIDWDNTDKLLKGLPAWSATRGSFRLPREEFVQEVRSFHARLMEQMGQRVEDVLAGALSPDVCVDMLGLQKEHAQRRESIESAFRPLPVATDWRAIHEALSNIDRGAHDRPI